MLALEFNVTDTLLAAEGKPELFHLILSLIQYFSFYISSVVNNQYT